MSSEALLTSGAVLLQMLLSFLFVALFCSSRTYKWSQNFCLWSCTLEQILAYPINNFLIPCYHSKLLRVMLNTFCSNRTVPFGMVSNQSLALLVKVKGNNRSFFWLSVTVAGGTQNSQVLANRLRCSCGLIASVPSNCLSLNPFRTVLLMSKAAGLTCRKVCVS